MRPALARTLALLPLIFFPARGATNNVKAAANLARISYSTMSNEQAVPDTLREPVCKANEAPVGKSNGAPDNKACEATASKVNGAEDMKPPGEKPLPPLPPDEFRAYNRMAEHMNYFHEHFRESWKTMYEACQKNKRPSGMSIRQFMDLGIEFCHYLDVHHSIEERHIFPVLAKRMPAFRKELELLTQHKQIHKGLDKFQAYLEVCKAGEKDFRMEEMKDLMDSFGEVLWQHLDDEVKELGAENMRKYWTKEEIRRLPM